MNFTPKTLKKLLLLMLVLGVINTGIVLLLGAEVLFPILGFTIVLFYIIMAMSKDTLKDKVIGQILKQINFQEIADKSYLTNFLIGKTVNSFQRQKSEYEMGWQGKLNGSDLEVLKFSVTVGSGKSAQLTDYLGIKIQTNLTGIQVQVFDNKNIINNLLPKQTNLESVEFAKQFRVYTQDQVEGFYILPPDVMHDLMVLREKLGTEINLEVNDGYILIFINTVNIDTMLEDLISMNEAMEQKLDQADLEPFKKILLDALQSCKDIFVALDVKRKL